MGVEKPKLPGWLKLVNPVVMFLNRSGLPVGPMEVLTTTGRRSGRSVSTPISVLTVDGQRYICTVGDTNWVLNVSFFRYSLGISGSPESFEQSADRGRGFRIVT
jgi:F420H(2)-dependent quinone reductase